MTDRTTPNMADAPDAPDALVNLYQQANAQDPQATGPSSAASDRILAHAHAQAAANAVNPTLRPAPAGNTTFHGEPANDRRWLRHALGGLAAIGLVGLLTLHHLDEPGAPQLDSPASAPQAKIAAQPAQPAAEGASAAASTPTRHRRRAQRATGW